MKPEAPPIDMIGEEKEFVILPINNELFEVVLLSNAVERELILAYGVHC